MFRAGLVSLFSLSFIIILASGVAQERPSPSWTLRGSVRSLKESSSSLSSTSTSNDETQMDGLIGDAISHYHNPPPPSVSPTPPPTSSSVHPKRVYMGWRNDLLKAVNEERTTRGLTPVCYNWKLMTTAAVHSFDMHYKNYRGHTDLDGMEPWDRLSSRGYDWNRVAENIAWGQTSVSEVVEAWMASEGHRDNILNEEYTHMGIGEIDWVWTQLFARPEGDSNESCD